jgi:hypothetical protein
VATTIAKLTKYAGGRDVWGGHGTFHCFYTGPTSYQGGVGGGDLVVAFGGQTAGSPELIASNCPLRNIDCIPAVVDSSGTFRVEAGPLGGVNPSFPNAPPKIWALRWITISTGAEVANTTNQSTFFAVLTIIGG